MDEKNCELMVDLDPGMVWVRGERLVGTFLITDFYIFRCLVENGNRTVSHDELADTAWGAERPDGVPRSYVYRSIRRLRMKLEEDPSNPRIILTRVGQGYIIPFPFESMDGNSLILERAGAYYTERYSFGDVVVDYDRANPINAQRLVRDVWVKDKKLPRLKREEFRILDYLFLHRPRAVSYEELYRLGGRKRPWYEPQRPVDNFSIDKYIHRLRGMIEEDPSDPKIIITKVGYGYSIGE